MMSLLDKYLHDNLKQHTHCMSSDNEYVTLLKYAIHLNINLTAFPTLWAVLSTPLQGQQDDQLDGVTTPENAIDDDVVNMRTIYPPWSLDTTDMCDITQIANDKSIKGIRDEICSDTPVKTEINKPYIDNIDAYNRDRALRNKSLSDRLDLGQNSLLGARQVRVAVKHTDQIREFPEHLRQISLGKKIENTSYAIIDRNISFIPQVDGIVDSRDSLDGTPDSIDLTESPVKYTKT